MRPVSSIFALAVGACMQITTNSGTGGGPGAQPPATGGDGGTGGTNCFSDSTTSSVVLCEQVDRCPGIVVDPGLFPNCGFRLNASSPLDLECLCNDPGGARGALCPIGVPTSCAQAEQLLAGQSAVAVCPQVEQGRCLKLAGGDAGAGATCDPVCRSQCAGNPSCFQICGC